MAVATCKGFACSNDKDEGACGLKASNGTCVCEGRTMGGGSSFDTGLKSVRKHTKIQIFIILEVLCRSM